MPVLWRLSAAHHLSCSWVERQCPHYLHAGCSIPPLGRKATVCLSVIIISGYVPDIVQSSREELLEDIEELKKKVTGATEKIES